MSAAGARRWRSFGYGVALGAVLLLGAALGFTLAFPAAALRPLLEGGAARQGVELEIATLTTAFPPALIGRQIRVSSAALPALQVERLRLRPCWGAWLRGELAVCFDGELLGGTIAGEVARTGRFAVAASGLDWQGTLPQAAGMTLAARLRQGSVAGTWPPNKESDLSLALQLEGVEARGVLGSPAPLVLGNVTVRGAGRGGNLQLTTVEATGGGVGVSGDGSVLVTAPLPRSPLKLNLTLRPAPELPPTWATLLTALVPPGADGVSRLRLGGALGQPKKL